MFTNTIIFCILILVFVFTKLEYLVLPFIWDEAWVYGNAVVEFSSKKIPWLPEAAYLDYTRGHPLFFYILFSIWGKLIGNSVTSLHLLQLIITIFFLGFVYFKMRSLFSLKTLLLVVVLLIANEIFFTQSSLILPEVTLGILLLFSFYFSISNKWILYVIFYTLALYTKESGLVLYPAVLITIIYNKLVFRTGENILKQIALASLPVIFFSLHFVYQKYTFGWFFYPTHIDLIEFDYASIENRFTGFSNCIFNFRYQFVFFFLFVLSNLYLVNKNDLLHKQRKVTVIILSILSTIAVVINVIYQQGVLISMSFWLFSMGLSLLSIQYKTNQQKLFINGAWLFISGFLLFSSLNFYSVRYITSIIIFYVFVQSFCYAKIIKAFRVPIVIPLLLVYILLTIGKNDSRTIEDVDTTYKYSVRMLQKVVNYMSANAQTNDFILTDFIERTALSNSNIGYLKEEAEFKNLKTNDNCAKSFKIISNIEDNFYKKKTNVDTTKWRSIKSFKIKNAEAEIYELID